MAPVNKTALECVMEVDHERIKLEAEAERLAAISDDDGKVVIEKSYDRICFLSENEQLTKKKRTHTCKNRKKEPDVTKYTERKQNNCHHRFERFN